MLGPFVELTSQRTEAESVFHLYVVRTDDRDGLAESLSAAGISTGLHYPIPCHRQRPYLDSNGTELPIAEDAARRQISLPIFPHITDAQIEATVVAVRDHSSVRAERAVL